MFILGTQRHEHVVRDEIDEQATTENYAYFDNAFLFLKRIFWRCSVYENDSVFVLIHMLPCVTELLVF